MAIEYVLFRRNHHHVDKIHFGCYRLVNGVRSEPVCGDSAQELAQQYASRGHKLVFGDITTTIPQRERTFGQHVDDPVQEKLLETFESEFSKLTEGK